MKFLAITRMVSEPDEVHLIIYQLFKYFCRNKAITRGINYFAFVDFKQAHESIKESIVEL